MILGVSGASGAALAMECARVLARSGVEVDLTLSPMAERTLALEIGPHAQAELAALAARGHPIRDLGRSHRLGLVSGGRDDRGAVFDAQPGGHCPWAGRQPSDPRRRGAVEGTPPADPAGARGAADAGASAQHDGGHRNGRHRPAAGARLLPAPANQA